MNGILAVFDEFIQYGKRLSAVARQNGLPQSMKGVEVACSQCFQYARKGDVVVAIGHAHIGNRYGVPHAAFAANGDLLDCLFFVFDSHFVKNSA